MVNNDILCQPLRAKHPKVFVQSDHQKSVIFNSFVLSIKFETAFVTQGQI